MASTPTFRFFLFGPPGLIIDKQHVALPPQPAAFCAFLILNRQRRITREEVQTAFWPDALPARAQERLRRTLYLLRKAIHPHTTLVAAEGAELAIAPEARLWVDYEEFEKALMDAYRGDPPDRAALARAVDLYADDLLKDIYADWSLLEREHARQRFLTALRHLMLACQRDGDWPDTIRSAHRLLEQDPLQEVAHRALMTAYAATGDRSAALRQYQQCVEILDEEVAAEPLPETTQLYNDIRDGKGVAAVTVPAPLTPAAPTTTDLQAVPLVGRERELGEIAAEWRISREGRSRLLLVTGSAGMGKTRLVQEAAARVPGAGVTVLTGHCYAMEAGTPYQLIADLMRQAVDMAGERLPAAVRAELAPLLPALQPETAPSAPGRSVLAPDASVRLQDAVTQVVSLLASSGKGLWLVTEDLHWADPASLACLNHALRRCHELPLMVLATLRDEEVSYDSPLMDWPASSVSAPAPTTLIRLDPLAPDDLAQLLTSMVDADIAHLAGLLHRETAGNPFFVVETLRALLEQGVLYVDADGHWQLRGEALPQAADLPLSDAALRLIRGRVRRLSRPAQAVLTVAAVIEHDIDERLLETLVDPSIALDLALDELLRAHILAEAAPGVYEFSHIKVREITYADTSAPRCRFLHRRIAEALSAQPGHERLAVIAQLAYHYAQARDWTHALAHAWRAAQTAWLAGALAEANRYAENAQHILDGHGDELDPALLPESLAAMHADLLLLRAEFRRQAATAGLYYPPDLLDAIERLLPDVGDSRRARAALQRATHQLGQGDLDGARKAATQGRTLYAGLSDRWGEMDAIQHQIDIAYRAGDMVTMRALLGDMRTLGERVDPAAIRAILATNDMRLAVYEGSWSTVLELAHELSEAQQGRVDASVAWLSLANLGLAYLKLGAYEQAYDIAQQAVTASEDANVLGLGARVLLARLELYRGNLDVACDALLSLLETPDPLMGEVEVASPALVLVRCCVAAGDDDGAQRWAKRTAQAMSRVRLPILYPLSQVAWALTHIAAKRYQDAQRRLLYPLEYLLLLEDTSPQEIFVLRAAAARGLRDHAATRDWLKRASEALREQAATISDPALRESFLNAVPLHTFIQRAARDATWQPADAVASAVMQPHPSR